MRKAEKGSEDRSESDVGLSEGRKECYYIDIVTGQLNVMDIIQNDKVEHRAE